MRPDIKKVQKKLWDHCKRIVRKRDKIADTHWLCYTCGKVITAPKDANTGHFIPRSTCGAILKYDLRNLRVQCMACNVWKGGNGALFYRNMIEREGQEYVDNLFNLKGKTVKALDHYLELLCNYEKM